jgi:hypothetical protein
MGVESVRPIWAKEYNDDFSHYGRNFVQQRLHVEITGIVMTILLYLYFSRQIVSSEVNRVTPLLISIRQSVLILVSLLLLLLLSIRLIRHFVELYRIRQGQTLWHLGFWNDFAEKPERIFKGYLGIILMLVASLVFFYPAFSGVIPNLNDSSLAAWVYMCATFFIVICPLGFWLLNEISTFRFAISNWSADKSVTLG